MFCLILQRKQAKLVGEPKVEILRVRPCAVPSSYIKFYMICIRSIKNESTY
ncbi:hypothetical protein HMPREF9554_00490 [Treponema phagedenis F0421]|nr:hypothetical protein HMPREF9554_00490 [Treponema phagedenis F0421]